MCDICNRNDHGNAGGIRPCPATEEELNTLRRARLITDPRKLQALLPAWLKRELATDYGY